MLNTIQSFINTDLGAWCMFASIITIVAGIRIAVSVLLASKGE